jgi:hypothetical protein
VKSEINLLRFFVSSIFVIGSRLVEFCESVEAFVYLDLVFDGVACRMALADALVCIQVVKVIERQ